MYKAVILVTIAIAASGCGPEHGDHEDDPPGELEYEMPVAKFYRSDRRVDVVGTDPATDPSGCGFLTDRAYDDLMSTYDALDPAVDYGVYLDCPQTGPPQGDRFYLDGFEYSPFECAWYCCHPDLIRAATVYFAAGSNLDGQFPNIDGEPYVALEPDMPCPD